MLGVNVRDDVYDAHASKFVRQEFRSGTRVPASLPRFTEDPRDLCRP